MNQNTARFIVRPDGTKFWPVNSPRINPAFESTDLRQFDTNSLYSSFQLRIQKRFRAALQFQGSYTYGRSFSNANGTVFTDARGIPSGNFGRISNTTTTSRQIQFALKLIF